MQKEWILTLALIFVILTSGCISLSSLFHKNEGKPKPKDEALKMDISLKGKNPQEEISIFPNQTFDIQVSLINQGGKDIKNVHLNLTDPYGLHLNRINYKDYYGKIKECDLNSRSCSFSLPSWSQIFVYFSFRAPDKDEVALIGTELKPEFTLTYDFGGNATFYVPILSEKETSTKAKTQLIQTKGPIHIKIERANQEEEWEVEGNPFAVLISFEDVVNPNSGVEINQNNFTLSLVEPLERASSGQCDFSRHDEKWHPTRNITLPMTTPLICLINATSTNNQPWTYGKITAHYSYEYKVVRTQKISIKTKIV